MPFFCLAKFSGDFLEENVERMLKITLNRLLRQYLYRCVVCFQLILGILAKFPHYNIFMAIWAHASASANFSDVLSFVFPWL